MKKITVGLFAGASEGVEAHFLEQAHLLGEWIGESEFDLVYGGSFVGCMGAVAKGALEKGATVTGVIPEYWKDLLPVSIENLHSILTKDLFDRKRIMLEQSDAFVAFPGGVGTIDELFEVLTLNQIGQMNKPLILLNLDGYFEPMLNLLSHAEEKGFIGEGALSLMKTVNSVEELRRLDFKARGS